MSADRCRFISTKTSKDPNFIKLINEYGTDIGLFYLLLIPATEPSGIIHDATPESLKWQIVPGFCQYDVHTITDMLIILHNNDFIYWDQENDQVLFHPTKFYQYQYNIQLDRQRKPEDHPVRTSVLKRTRKVVSKETQEKFDEVWRIIPQSYKSQSWLEHQIKECILQYDFLSAYDFKMAMLSVLEKFDGKRSDIGFLFSNAVKWKSTDQINESNAINYDSFKSEYEELLKQSQSLAVREISH